MAQNIGTLISSTIRPNNSDDLIASAWSSEIKGGLHVADNTSSRNSIIVQRREWGMLCYVKDLDLTFQLKYNNSSTLITDNGNWVEYNSGLSLFNIKKYVGPTDYIIVPQNTQYWIYGDLVIDGTIENYGDVIITNGSLNYGTYSGTFSNYNNLTLNSFAEIDGLGQVNYIPRWKTNYMLSATSSIYDDGESVILTGTTFSINSNLVIPNGATSGAVLTSDSNGVATWNLPVSTIQEVTSTSSVTPTSSDTLVIVTTQSEGLTLQNPTGTWLEGQDLLIRIKDNGTTRSLSYGVNYRAIGVTLPTFTTANKTIYLGIVYNNTDSKWDIIGVSIQS